MSGGLVDLTVGKCVEDIVPLRGRKPIQAVATCPRIALLIDEFKAERR
jgi:hypothetical protein